MLKALALATPALAGFKPASFKQENESLIMTVRGPIEPMAMGNSLIHEHILVDFIGAEKIDPSRWVDEKVIQKVLPYLEVARNLGCQTLVDCTPNYLGRDVVLLEKLSVLGTMNIITNTGYYGGSDNKFLPPHALTESAEQLSERWISEWKNGIDATSIKPGFIKTSVNPGKLSEVSKKLVMATAFTHLKTGLTIASHTGPAIAAFEEIEILKNEGVHPSAFIWVHAQNEKDWNKFVNAAREGAWVSLDGLNENNLDQYKQILSFLKKEECLNRVLISHDAGWYDPAQPDGGSFRNYDTLFKMLIPVLKQENFEEKDVEQLIKINPRNAFAITVKKL